MYNVVQVKSYRKNPVTKQLEGQTKLVSQELTHSLGDLAQEGLHKRGPLWGVKNNGRQRHLFLPHPFFSSCSTLKSLILSVSRNLHCHPPKVPGFFHSFTMNAYRTCHHSWTLPGSDHLFMPPLEVPEAPDSQYTAAGQPIATGVPAGASGRKEVRQKMWGKIPVLGWDLGGSGGEVMPWGYS